MFSIIPPRFLKSTCYVFIFLCSFSALAQVNDSIHRYSHNELDSLYWAHIDKDILTSKKYAHVIFRKATKENNYKRIAKALLRISMIESELKNFNSAHEHIDKAISVIESELKDPSLKNEYLVYKGNIFYTAAEYNKALEYYTKSYQYEKEANNIQNTLNIAHNIALIRTITGNLEEAINIFKSNYAIFSSQEQSQSKDFSSSNLLTTLMALSDTYIELSIKEKNRTEKIKLLDSATRYNAIGFQKSTQYDNSYKYNSFLVRKSMIAYESGNYSEAIKDLTIADTKAQEIQQEKEFSTIYFQLAKNHQKNEALDNAIYFFKKVDSISNINVKQSRYLPETYLALTDLYLKKEDVENVLKYHNLFVEIDKINDKQTIEMQKKIYEDYDIPLLNDKIQKLTNTTKKQESKYTTTLTVLVILICAFLGFVLYNRNKQRKNRLAFDKLIQELEAQKKEVASKKPEPSKTKNTISAKPKSTISIDDEKVNEILKALEKFEQKKQFLDIGCDLTFVAKKAKTNKAYLSKVIHIHKQQKFIQYITTLRINYALKRLKEDKVFRSYDIKSIAGEVGYKSSESFSRAFKSKTGIYPSYYIKNINKINDLDNST